MFEWEVTINLHDENGKIIRSVNHTVYAATLHDARGQADKYGKQLASRLGADFWTVVSVV